MYRFSTAFFAGAMDMNGLSFGAVTKRRSSRNVRHLFYPNVQLHRSASTRMSNQSGYESITVNQSNGRKATATNQMQLIFITNNASKKLAPFLALPMDNRMILSMLLLTSCVLRYLGAEVIMCSKGNIFRATNLSVLCTSPTFLCSSDSDDDREVDEIFSQSQTKSRGRDIFKENKKRRENLHAVITKPKDEGVEKTSIGNRTTASTKRSADDEEVDDSFKENKKRRETPPHAFVTEPANEPAGKHYFNLGLYYRCTKNWHVRGLSCNQICEIKVHFRSSVKL